MKTTTSVVLTGAIVAAGQWADDKQISIKMVVGVGILALSLAALSEVNSTIAEQFGVLILVGAFLIYVVPVTKALKLT